VGAWGGEKVAALGQGGGWDDGPNGPIRIRVLFFFFSNLEIPIQIIIKFIIIKPKLFINKILIL
jgi:hypothetical protein